MQSPERYSGRLRGEVVGSAKLGRAASAQCTLAVAISSTASLLVSQIDLFALHAALLRSRSTGAEIYKPAKAPPAPVPQPARPAKQQQQQAAAGKKAAAPTGGVTLGRKFRYSAGSSARSNPQPFGAAATSTGSGQPPGRPPPFAPASAGGGGGSFFKGPRPPELTLCREVSEAGRCYIHNCRFAHSEVGGGWVVWAGWWVQATGAAGCR